MMVHVFTSVSDHEIKEISPSITADSLYHVRIESVYFTGWIMIDRDVLATLLFSTAR